MAEGSDAIKVRVCSKCHKPMNEKVNYYISKRLDLYPENGVIDKCKKCFTMHININEPSSFLDLLEKIDIPYIESEWKALVDKYGDNPKTTPTAIFGRYVSKMKLKQFNKYCYADTEKFVEEEKMRQMKERADKLAQINKYRDAQDSGIAFENLEELGINQEDFSEEEIKKYFTKPEELFNADSIEDSYEDITKDDKTYLLQKWGKTYTIPECIKLEKLFLEMMESYDIRTASHFDYLLKICRISLKIDQALEVNDIDAFQKMTKVYDMLMKSAKFTAAQNKEQSDDYIDAVGNLVAMCEEKGFIPKYHNEERQDIVDYTLKDFKGYLEKLVKNEANLGNMIEIYLQKMVDEQNKEEDEMADDDDDDIVILTEKEEQILKDSDFVDFSDMIEEEIELDEDMLNKSGDI